LLHLDPLLIFIFNQSVTVTAVFYQLGRVGPICLCFKWGKN